MHGGWTARVIGLSTGSSRGVFLLALLREYHFAWLFRGCAESLSIKNASRPAAMQRADKNIDELPKDLNGTSNRVRHSGIDKKLFNGIFDFEALNMEEK